MVNLEFSQFSNFSARALFQYFLRSSKEDKKTKIVGFEKRFLDLSNNIASRVLDTKPRRKALAHAVNASLAKSTSLCLAEGLSAELV